MKVIIYFVKNQYNLVTLYLNLQENNDIVKRAKNMSAMAFSMYQFTRGEGVLKTTQDLFTQAEYFAEEANRLYKVIRQFSYQVNSNVLFINYYVRGIC